MARVFRSKRDIWLSALMLIAVLVTAAVSAR
jgi:hypothetical protein